MWRLPSSRRLCHLCHRRLVQPVEPVSLPSDQQWRGAYFHAIGVRGGPPGGTWLTVPNSPQSTPGAVTITIDATGLPSGTYLGYLTLTAAGAGNSPDRIPIILTVFPTSAFQVTSQAVQFGTITGKQTDNSIQVFTSDLSIVSFSIIVESYVIGSNWFSLRVGQ